MFIGPSYYGISETYIHAGIEESSNPKMYNFKSNDYTFSSLAADLRRGAAGFS